MIKTYTFEDCSCHCSDRVWQTRGEGILVHRGLVPVERQEGRPPFRLLGDEWLGSGQMIFGEAPQS